MRRTPQSRGGRPIDLPSPEDRVVRSLRDRVAAGSPLGDGARATITFDAGHAARSDVIAGKTVELAPGGVPRADTVVRADAVTLASVLAGDESGVYAFPDGRLTLRGSQLHLEEASGEHGFRARLPALSRPALSLWGDADRLVPARFAPHGVAAVPRARALVLEDCGHLPQLERPARTHRRVRAFLCG